MSKIAGTIMVQFESNSTLSAYDNAVRMKNTLEAALKQEWQASRCEPEMKTFDYVEISTFDKIKKGEFFRFPGGKKVYKYDGTSSKAKKKNYHYYDVDDVNNAKSTKTNREIEIGFTY